jgi:hypothetical protein
MIIVLLRSYHRTSPTRKRGRNAGMPANRTNGFDLGSPLLVRNTERRCARGGDPSSLALRVSVRAEAGAAPQPPMYRANGAVVQPSELVPILASRSAASGCVGWLRAATAKGCTTARKRWCRENDGLPATQVVVQRMVTSVPCDPAPVGPHHRRCTAAVSGAARKWQRGASL